MTRIQNQHAVYYHLCVYQVLFSPRHMWWCCYRSASLGRRGPGTSESSGTASFFSRPSDPTHPRNQRLGSVSKWSKTKPTTRKAVKVRGQHRRWVPWWMHSSCGTFTVPSLGTICVEQILISCLIMSPHSQLALWQTFLRLIGGNGQMLNGIRPTFDKHPPPPTHMYLFF